jgi:hypothetical protein
MTRFRAAGVVALLAACGTSTQSARRQVTVPLAKDDAFARAMSVVNEFGYTVRDADASAGFLRADRLSPARWNQFITGQRKVWILTVSVVVESAAYRYVVQPESRGRGRIGNDQKAQVDSIVAALRAEPR